MIDIYGGTLASIRAGDDTDGDGISNINEYIAGTYAYDPADGFPLALLGPNAGASSLELLAIRGRSYSLQGSSDLRTWTSVPFRLTGPGSQPPLLNSFQAADVRMLQVEVPAQPGVTNRYFRALVR